MSSLVWRFIAISLLSAGVLLISILLISTLYIPFNLDNSEQYGNKYKINKWILISKI